MASRRSDSDLASALALGSYVGGGYFNPAETVAEQYRRLDLSVDIRSSLGPMNLDRSLEPTYYISRLYSLVSSRLADGELLFAVYFRRAFSLAPYIFSEERCAEFEIQVNEGGLAVTGYYSVPYGQAEEGLRRDIDERPPA
jgi:hypothetical protein